jgi:hypothetical protein
MSALNKLISRKCISEITWANVSFAALFSKLYYEGMVNTFKPVFKRKV